MATMATTVMQVLHSWFGHDSTGSVGMAGRLGTAAHMLVASVLPRKSHTPHTPHKPHSNQIVVACEYQMSGIPLGDITVQLPASRQAIYASIQALLVTAANATQVGQLEQLGGCFSARIGHAGKNLDDLVNLDNLDEMLPADIDQLRTRPLVIGPFQLPERLTPLGSFFAVMLVLPFARMDAWMHGCMDAWMHGCMDAWLVWLVQTCNDTCWCVGVLVCWCVGVLVGWLVVQTTWRHPCQPTRRRTRSYSWARAATTSTTTCCFLVSERFSRAMGHGAS